MPAAATKPTKPRKPVLELLLEEKKAIIEAVRSGKPASSVPPIQLADR